MPFSSVPDRGVVGPCGAAAPTIICTPIFISALPAGQLLGLTIQREQPELEAQKSALLQQEEGLKVQLAEVERNLLQVRKGAGGGGESIIMITV